MSKTTGSNQPPHAGFASVTREREAQSALYDAMLSSFIDFAYTFDLDGRFLFANRALLDLWGKQPGDEVGKNFFDLGYPPELAARLQGQIKVVIDTGKPVKGETPYTGAAGGTEYYEYLFSPIFRENKIIAVSGITRVVTERKQREEKLAELTRQKEDQSRLFDATLSSIKDLAYTFDLEGNWIYANQPLLKLWGKPLEAIVGKSSLQLGYPPELAQRLKDQVKEVVSTRKPFKGETLFTDAAGVEDYHEYIFSPVFATDGSVSAVCGTTRLITERKRAEQNSNFLSQLSQTLAGLSDPAEINRVAAQAVGQFMKVDRCYFCEWKWNGEKSQLDVQYDWHNGNAPSLAGFHELINFGPERWIEKLRHEYLAITDLEAENIGAKYRDSFRSLQIRAYATSRFLQQDADVINLAVTTDHPRQWREDELQLLESVAARVWPLIERARADQSLRKRSERVLLVSEFLGRLLNSSDLELILREVFAKAAAHLGTDTFLNFIATDKGNMMRLHGFAGISAEDAAGIQDREFGQGLCGLLAAKQDRLSLADLQKSDCPDAQFLLGRGYKAYIGSPLLLGDQLLGTISFATRNRTAFSEDEREFVNAIGRYTAIAIERKNSERALRKSRADLEEHAKHLEHHVTERTAKLQETIAELESFSYSISHDLRAPLRAMQSFATILAEECGAEIGPDGKDYIRRIVTSAERMDRLIQDILIFSRIARTDLKLEIVDMDKLVRGIIESYPQFHSVKAEIEIEGTLPPVLGNEASLTQCVSNILGNAVKFVAPGTRPRVKVWGREQNGLVRVSFQDNGIGIAAEHQDRIFGIFQQLDKSFDGTGIGLAIVRKAAERMGGRVGLESEPKRGSTFWLELKAQPHE